MKKHEFLTALEQALSGVKAEERREILSDFEEHFSSGLASGKSEEEVAHELGNPRELAAQYTEGQPADAPAPRASLGQGIVATAALLCFDVIIALPAVSTLLGVWVALWAVDLAIFACSLAGFALPFMNNWSYPVPLMGKAGVFCWGISLLALCGLWSIGMYYATRTGYRALVEFGRLHLRIIQGVSR